MSFFSAAAPCGLDKYGQCYINLSAFRVKRCRCVADGMAARDGAGQGLLRLNRMAQDARGAGGKPEPFVRAPVPHDLAARLLIPDYELT